MELIFFRHGDAEDVGPDGSDFARRLTSRGELESERVARFILQSGSQPDRLISSPLVRARQTAERVVRVLGPDLQPQVDDRLKSGAQLEDVEGIVADNPSKRLLLVGHEPDFSRIIGALIGDGRVDMKKSAAACVDVSVVQSGAGELRWLVRPDLIPHG
jgi:phosphohistidine phosphatase